MPEEKKLFKVTIDNITIEVEPARAYSQAARKIGGDVAPPAMCYYTPLKGSGGKCRTCLVEVAAGSTADPRPMPKLGSQLPYQRNGRHDRKKYYERKSNRCKKWCCRIFIDQSSARLPYLRSGRRMSSAGSQLSNMVKKEHVTNSNEELSTA